MRIDGSSSESLDSSHPLLPGWRLFFDLVDTERRYRVSPEIPVSSNYRFLVSSTAMVFQSTFGEMLILFKQCKYWQKNHRQLKIQWKIWSLECLLPHNSILLFCDSSHFGTQHLTYCFIATFCAGRAAQTPLLLSVQARWASRTRQGHDNVIFLRSFAQGPRQKNLL